jgi:hypothetical protein
MTLFWDIINKENVDFQLLVEYFDGWFMIRNTRNYNIFFILQGVIPLLFTEPKAHVSYTIKWICLTRGGASLGAKGAKPHLIFL